jgi:hypothetical protein
MRSAVVVLLLAAAALVRALPNSPVICSDDQTLITQPHPGYARRCAGHRACQKRVARSTLNAGRDGGFIIRAPPSYVGAWPLGPPHACSSAVLRSGPDCHHRYRQHHHQQVGVHLDAGPPACPPAPTRGSPRSTFEGFLLYGEVDGQKVGSWGNSFEATNTFANCGPAVGLHATRAPRRVGAEPQSCAHRRSSATARPPRASLRTPSSTLTVITLALRACVSGAEHTFAVPAQLSALMALRCASAAWSTRAPPAPSGTPLPPRWCVGFACASARCCAS